MAPSHRRARIPVLYASRMPPNSLRRSSFCIPCKICSGGVGACDVPYVDLVPEKSSRLGPVHPKRAAAPVERPVGLVDPGVSGQHGFVLAAGKDTGEFVQYGGVVHNLW